MCSEEPFYAGTPPRLPGHYRIRDADGDIAYWGDAENLYDTWCKKVRDHSFMENITFEYALADQIKIRHV